MLWYIVRHILFMIYVYVYVNVSFICFQTLNFKLRDVKGMKGGFYEKAEELGCTYEELFKKYKHFRDTISKFHRPVEKRPKFKSGRDKFILQHFSFLLEAVHPRENARKVNVSCYFNMYMIQRDVWQKVWGECLKYPY